MQNYRTICLLPIFGNIFERVIFKDSFNHFHKNELFTTCESGFRPDDSYISYLLSIVHDINCSFVCDPTQDIRDVFINIFKAFVEVWHEGLLYKLETYGVKEEVLNLHNYPHERYQRVVRNGQTSSWELRKSAVPQGSVGPLMFLIYINDLPENIQSTCKIFADDTSLFSHVSDKPTSQSELNKDLQAISNWISQWKMQFNPHPNKQAQEVNFSTKTSNLSSHPVSFNNTKV